jgi:outer membrane protein assembly factor BamE (lipoprotein component of BamABCDE complex)
MRPLILSLIFSILACSSSTQISMQTGKMIVPGVGTDEVHVGMLKTEIIELLGEPEAADDQGQMLHYEDNYGLDLFLADGEHVAEIHFGQSFQGRLPSRVKVGSRMQDVFKAYGTPTKMLEVLEDTVSIEDRVLYKAPSASRISYNRLGLSFWFSSQKRVARIVVFKPLPNRNIRVEPQKVGSRQFDQ